MNYRIFIFISISHLLTAYQAANGQECSIEAREKLKNLDYTLNVVDSTIFLKIQPTKIVEKVTLKSEDFFTSNYPKLFKLNNSCYTFKGLNDKKFKICKSDQKADIKAYMNYEFKGILCDKALIYFSEYEYWGYLMVDLDTGLAHETMGEPVTWDCVTFISHSNYYGEEEISIFKLSPKKEELVITIEGWKTEEVKQSNQSYFLKLNSFSCYGKAEFLEINLK